MAKEIAVKVIPVPIVQIKSNVKTGGPGLRKVVSVLTDYMVPLVILIVTVLKIMTVIVNHVIC